MACHGSFPSCRGESDITPSLVGIWIQTSRDVLYILLGRCNQQIIFAHFFVVFVPDYTTIATDPRVVELVCVSFPVEHPHEGQN